MSFAGRETDFGEKEPSPWEEERISGRNFCRGELGLCAEGGWAGGSAGRLGLCRGGAGGDWATGGLVPEGWSLQGRRALGGLFAGRKNALYCGQVEFGEDFLPGRLRQTVRRSSLFCRKTPPCGCSRGGLRIWVDIWRGGMFYFGMAQIQRPLSQPKVNSPASSSVTVCAPLSAVRALEMLETSPKAWP